jgi:hypothetical protein
MSRTPARFTQADIARAVRAAKQAGASRVRVLRDGIIEIDLSGPAAETADQKCEAESEVVL